MNDIMLPFNITLIILAMPIASVIAWGWPRSYRILLLSFVSSTLLTVVSVRLLWYYDPGYLRALYVDLIGFLCLAMWLVCAGLPGAWLRQGHKISRDQIVSLLIALIATVAWSNQPSYPTANMVKERRAYFMKHRSTFDQLARMVCEDMPVDANSFLEAINGWSPGVTHFSPARLATYHQLFHDIGVTPQAVGAQGNLSFLSLPHETLNDPKDRAMGYEYSCDTIVPQPLVHSLDVPGPLGQQRYQILAPHWYLRDVSSWPVMP